MDYTEVRLGPAVDLDLGNESLSLPNAHICLTNLKMCFGLWVYLVERLSVKIDITH